jgi:hypothetical protein
LALQGRPERQPDCGCSFFNAFKNRVLPLIEVKVVGYFRWTPALNLVESKPSVMLILAYFLPLPPAALFQ